MMVVIRSSLGGSYEPVNPIPEPKPEPEPDSTLSNNNWETIAKVAEAGEGSQYWNIGDTIDISVGGTTLTFVIADFNHDDKSDGTGKAGITFTMTGMYGQHSMHSSATTSGSFISTSMYAYLRDTVLPSMPEEVRNVIKPVNKITNVGGNSDNTRTDSMSIWLYSVTEVGLVYDYMADPEGYAYPYYTASTRNKGGEWWLRSPRTEYSRYYCLIDSSDTDMVHFRYATSSCGVSFGFCV